MLTSLNISNFKRFGAVEIELGQTVVLIGPNNSGKTTVLQALSLWYTGLRKWQALTLQRSLRDIVEEESITTLTTEGVATNRLDLISIPVPDTKMLWRNQYVRNDEDIHIRITVTGVAETIWTCAFNFWYSNKESIYASPGQARGNSLYVPDETKGLNIAFLPPMSGLIATEDYLQPGSIFRRIGEGRTAEVLRNLCYQLYTSDDGKGKWHRLTDQFSQMFKIDLLPPFYNEINGVIEMVYQERGTRFDLSAAGRGMLQILLLLAYLYNNPGAVLLLDEPDAHLEILRQRQVYQLLTDVAREQNSQIIAASHSEVILNEAADRDMVVSLVGKPRRIDKNERSQLAKALKEIDAADYYQAEQTGWVLYLEGSTDLAILRAFAQRLAHPVSKTLERPFVHYLHSNKPSDAEKHYQGLRVAKPDLVGFALFDRIPQRQMPGADDLVKAVWRRREIENYLLQQDTLLRYAASGWGDSGQAAMEAVIAEVENALRVLRKPGIWSPDLKASEEVFDPLFERFFQKLNLPNLLRKSDYHILAQFIPVEQIDPEVTEKLDAIVEVARRAKPRED